MNSSHPSQITMTSPVDCKKIYIDKKWVVDYKHCLDIYFCKICYSLLKNPKTCEKCEELFCYDCLTNSLITKNSCPYCRQTPFKAAKLNKVIKNTLDSIEVLCPLNCGEKSTMENLEKHFLNKCTKSNYTYFVCDTCRKNFDNKNKMDLHVKKCPEALFSCPYWQRFFEYKKIFEHLKTCDENFTLCENCYCKIPLKFLLSHSKYYCGQMKMIKENIEVLAYKLGDLGIKYLEMNFGFKNK